MRVFGHPLHAVLVAFPLGLLTLVPLWDALAWLGVSGASGAAYLGQIAGVVGGLLAALTGSIDFVRAKKSPAIEKLGLWHATAAVTGLSVFAVGLALRSEDHTAAPLVVALEAAGVVCFAVAGWCGGHLVFHHGVAVRDSSKVELR
jgi:uncharacterized membrane protein